MITIEEVLKALSYVDDPDLGKDLVTLNMVQDIVASDEQISFTVMLTTPACPMKDAIEKACENAIRHLVSKTVPLKIKMSSQTTSQRVADANLLPGVKNIIAIASGKGGVGKSTVAVNLAIALSKIGASVGIIDADIYGPSIPMMLNIGSKRPEVFERNGKHAMLPVEQYGIKALSIGMLIDESQAIVWRGPMASSALKQFVNDCEWGELDYLIFDLPPGTGDIHLTLVQTIPVTCALLVTTPQDVALADAKKAAAMFQLPQVNVPIIGVVENMSYFTPAELPSNKYYLFGKGGGQKLADAFHVSMLAEIPLVQSIREGGDSGLPVSMQNDHPAAEVFEELAGNVARQIAIRNANFANTKKVEIAN